MKNEKRVKQVNKGMSTGIILSIAIHAALFFLAGLLVVFTVVQREEPAFDPPRTVERPKMKLKKPKMKVKSSSKPRSTKKIATKTKRTTMPVLDVPEIGGMGTGLGDAGIGGFDLFEGMTETTIFGSGLTVGNDFVGHFYDLKRDRRGNGGEVGVAGTREIIAKFAKNGFDTTKLAKYYRSEKKLYATCFMVPTVPSEAAPKAFGEQTGGWSWLAHYRGKLVHEEGITFRFRGQGDDVMIVMVDGKVVLNGSWPGTEQQYTPHWQSMNAESRQYRLGNNYAVVGDWITLEPGVPLDMEVALAEIPGGEFDAMLVVEVEGVDYPRNAQQGPILPMFKTAEPSHDLCDIIFKKLIPGEASVTNGPVFADFSVKATAKKTVQPEVEDSPSPKKPAPDPVRTWQLASKKSMEGELICFIADQVVLKTGKGKQIKIPFSQISAEDQEYVELLHPPELNITFTKQSKQQIGVTSPYIPKPVPREFDWRFGVKIKQIAPRAYPHELTLEYFAVGQQLRDDSKYILFAREQETFVLNNENGRSYEFTGERVVRTESYSHVNSQIFGEQYKGYMVLIRDKRGEIVQYATSNEWLYENREKLVELPVGSYFNRSCTRVHPTSPKRNY